jgi:hypothetical protein
MRRVTTALAARPVASVAAVALAGLLAAGSLGGRLGLAAAVLLVQAVLLAGWTRELDVPVTVPAIALPAAVAIATVGVLVARVDEPVLAPVVGLVAVAFVLALLVQLARRPPRDRLTPALTATVTAAVLVAATAQWLAAGRGPGGSGLVAVAAAAAAAGALAALAPVTLAALAPVALPARGVVAALAGAVVGAAAGSGVEAVGAASGAWLGAGVGAAVGLGTVAAGLLPGRGSRRSVLLGAALPVALGGPVVYGLGRLVVG